MKRVCQKLVAGIYQWLRRKRWLQIDQTRRIMADIHTGSVNQMEQSVTDYYQQIIARCLIMALLVIIASALAFVIGTVQSKFKSGIPVVRGDYGEDSQMMTLQYMQNQMSGQVSIEVAPVEYQKEELEAEFERGFQYIENQMLGDNASYDQIYGNLNLIDCIPDSCLEVSWICENYELVSSTGEIQTAIQTSMDCAKKTWIRLELCYGEEVRTKVYPIIIQPIELTEEEKLREAIQVKLQSYLEEEKYSREFILPVEMDGLILQSVDDTKRTWIWILVFGMIVIVLTAWSFKSKLQEKQRERKRILQQEYAYFVNQIVLYTTSGISIQGAIERIIRQMERGQIGRDTSPLYQELVRVNNEIHTGIPQEQAYLTMGRRIGLLSYVKLASILVQQIHTGAGSVSEQLEQEEHEAFERKKEAARKCGEEAGTKLLIPMVLLMVISMVLIMYPAFASMLIGGF